MMTTEQIKNVKQTLKELKELKIGYTLGNKHYENVSIEEATEVTVSNSDICNFFVRTIKIPKKKPFTKEYVLEKMFPKQKEYNNYSELFEKLSKCLGLDSMYSATYGLGFDGFVGKREDVFKLKDNVIAQLNSVGVKSDFEFSDASWVLRIKISKSVENINRIQEIIKCKNVA